MTAVRLRGLRKDFGADTVVDSIDLDIEAGEFFSLLGPSGCGKTTTLRMIAGFTDPTAGSIEVDGVDVTTTPPHRRDVNTVFQSYALFEHLDVRRNVGFGLRRKGLGKAEIEARVSEMLELVQLQQQARSRPAQLSGGQQQRVALARALINRPRVLLLDEPLAALDLKLRRAMQAELKAIQREVGITFLFVTHDQDEALSMSDRVAIMRAGVIEQCGTPEEVYESPTTLFAAGFIGTSNVMPGTVVAGGHALDLGGGIEVPLTEPSTPGERLNIAVRPEKIWLSDFDDGMFRTFGTLADTSYHGATTTYVVALTDQVSVTVLEQNLPRMTTAARPALGDRVELGWLPEHVLVLR